MEKARSRVRITCSRRFGALDEDAWHVAFMNSHERPQDPRLIDGSVEKTREKFHANDGVNLNGKTVNGRMLGRVLVPVIGLASGVCRVPSLDTA